MKVTVIDGAVVATSENIEEAAALIKFTKKVEQPSVTGTPIAPKKRGRASRFATEEERAAARKRYNKKWAKNRKLKLAAEAAGTPVAITKVETPNAGQ